jgi:ZIP family zinc transporter
MPIWLQAGGWGLLAGSALVLGAAIGYYAHIPDRLVAGIMAFGSGVLISALSFDLIEEAYNLGGFDATIIGIFTGSAIFTVANWFLTRSGAKHRKRSNHLQKAEKEESENGLALAIGALVDGIPESIVIGVSMIAGGRISMVTVIAIFLSNLPEGLSSSAGMRKAGRSAKYVLGLWCAIACISAIAAIIGYTVFSGFSPNVIAATTAVAAGAVLAMLADTMIPEAFEKVHDFTGMIMVAGFMTAFILTKMGG